MTATIDPSVGKEFIEHFGTRGMKWGVRRSREERAKGSGTKEEKKSKKDSSGPKTVVGKTKTEGKLPNNLSDVQLQKVVNRMNLEQQYARLNPPKATATQRLMKASTKFALEAGRSIAMQQVKSIGNEQASKKIAVLMARQAKSGIPIAPNRMAGILPDIATRVG